MSVTLRDRIQAMVNKGMTLEQVKAQPPPIEGYEPVYGGNRGVSSTDFVIEEMYKTLRPREVTSGAGKRSSAPVALPALRRRWIVRARSGLPDLRMLQALPGAGVEIFRHSTVSRRRYLDVLRGALCRGRLRAVDEGGTLQVPEQSASAFTTPGGGLNGLASPIFFDSAPRAHELGPDGQRRPRAFEAQVACNRRSPPRPLTEDPK